MPGSDGHGRRARAVMAAQSGSEPSQREGAGAPNDEPGKLAPARYTSHNTAFFPEREDTR